MNKNRQSFIYHRVADAMEGTVLYPLNVLKEKFPAAYKTHVHKYVGREELLTTKIPLLNCLWNDVLHFTAVHPKILFENLSLAGYNADEFVWKRWYEIPIDLLDQKNTIVCLYRRDKSVIPEARDFQSFFPSKLRDYAIVPQETIEYYREQKFLGKRPLFFHRVPHVLYKGNIDISDCAIVKL